MFGGGADQVDPLGCDRRAVVHGVNDRQQVAAGGGDVASIGGVVGAERAVAALDDLVGGGNDPVERRA